MRRRTLLRAVSVGTGAAFAGCLSGATRGVTSHSCLESGAVSFEAESDEFVVMTDNNAVESHVFTLRNQTACPITVDPKAWRIERTSGDGGEQVASGDGEGERITVSRGSVHAWSLSVVPHPSPHTGSKTFIVADLPEAAYVLEVTGMVNDEERVTRRATFDLVERSTTETEGHQ